MDKEVLAEKKAFRHVFVRMCRCASKLRISGNIQSAQVYDEHIEKAYKENKSCGYFSEEKLFQIEENARNRA